jgi:molybdopterin/thiamine biosynthesis adenylyltransferase
MSWMSYLLAKMDVSLTLVDRDVVEPRNLTAGNSVLREKDVGKEKAVAMKDFLKENVPGVPVEAHHADIMLLSDPELRALSSGAGVVLCLVDDGEAMFRLNDMFYPALPVVYAAGHGGARTGDVIFTRPGSACLKCLLNTDSPQDIRTLAGEPTHGIDIISICETCARVALILLGDERLGDLRELLDPSINFIAIQNRRSPASPRGFAPQFLRVRRRPDCPVCGAP